MTLELKVPPPVVMLAAGALMWGVSRYLPIVEASAAYAVAVAILLALIGIAMALAGVVSFRRARTTVHPLHPQEATALVTSGIYRLTRNPMYLGMLLILLGWALYLRSIWSLAGPLLFWWYIGRFQIAPEERVLTQLFGAPYVEWCRRVRRWL